MPHDGGVIEELTTDHREVEEIFGWIGALPAGDSRRQELADQATRCASTCPGPRSWPARRSTTTPRPSRS